MILLRFNLERIVSIEKYKNQDIDSNSLVVTDDTILHYLNEEDEEIYHDKDYILNHLTYSDNRLIEYSKLNQFELQFNDLRDNTTTWLDAIKEIKDKYPKSS